jgi:autotransporter-associated beta strand protein
MTTPPVTLPRALALALCLAAACPALLPAADFALTSGGGNQYSITTSAGDNLVIDTTSSFTVAGTIFGTSGATVGSGAGITVGDTVSGVYGTYAMANMAQVTSYVDGVGDVTWSPVTVGGSGNQAANLRFAKTITMNAAGTTDIGSITMSDVGNRIINIGTGNTLRLGAAGFINRTSDTTATERGGLKITGGSLTAGGADNTAGNISFGTTVGGSTNSTRAITNIIIESRVVDNGTGAVSLTKTGAYSAVLSNALNSYSGGTTVSAGRLISAVAGSLGTGSVTVNTGGQLALTGGGIYSNNVSIIGNGIITTSGNAIADTTAGALVLNDSTNLAGTVTLTGNAVIGTSLITSPTPATGSRGTISGKITGNYQATFGGGSAKSNTYQGILTLSNSANDWTGGTVIRFMGTTGEAFVLSAGADEVIPDGVGKGDLTFLIETNNRTAVLSLNGFDETVNGLNSPLNATNTGASKAIIRNNHASEASTFTVGNNNANGIYAGSIQDGAAGKLAVTKIGTGTQVFATATTNTFTYSGPTQINGGVLIIDGTLTASQVTVNSGGKLGGSGTFNQAVTAASGGTIGAGASAGIQNYTNTLTFSTGSFLEWELFSNTSSSASRGTAFDGINVNGTGVLSLDTGVVANLVFNGATSTVDFTSAFWDTDQSWLVFDLANAPDADLAAFFASFNATVDSLGNNFSVTGGTFTWSTVGTDLYLNYTQVPEPTAATLLLLAATTLTPRRRRR